LTKRRARTRGIKKFPWVMGNREEHAAQGEKKKFGENTWGGVGTAAGEAEKKEGRRRLKKGSHGAGRTYGIQPKRCRGRWGKSEGTEKGKKEVRPRQGAVRCENRGKKKKKKKVDGREKKGVHSHKKRGNQGLKKKPGGGTAVLPHDLPRSTPNRRELFTWSVTAGKLGPFWGKGKGIKLGEEEKDTHPGGGGGGGGWGGGVGGGGVWVWRLAKDRIADWRIEG